jgi:hypothetical protein
MRAGLAASKKADRLSGVVVLMAGVLSGVLVFVVALPLALSSPFPTPRQGDWVIQTALAQSSAAAAAPPRPMLASMAIAMPRPAPVATQPAFEETIFSARWDQTETRASETYSAEIPTGAIRLASADVSAPIEVAPPPAAQIAVPDEATQIKPAEPKSESAKGESTKSESTKSEAAPKKRDVNPMETVDNYLWEVYQRAPVKKDSSGDFSWKDPAAAKKRGISLQAYVIGGMDPDFREQLYHAGRAMDAAGIHWSMLSAFRDDYRQALASGFKARPGNSLHGGSRVTGGYGYGRAVDVNNPGGNDEAVWHWVDAHGAKYGLRRPMPGYDPAHIQSGGAWHEIAQSLRYGRTQVAEGPRKPATTAAAVRSRGARRAAM